MLAHSGAAVLEGDDPDVLGDLRAALNHALQAVLGHNSIAVTPRFAAITDAPGVGARQDETG
jgi:hypothetical protein